jgi:hypothetical protein
MAAPPPSYESVVNRGNSWASTPVIPRGTTANTTEELGSSLHAQPGDGLPGLPSAPAGRCCW